MDIGERISEGRTRLGLTQERLAKAVGIGRSALAKIETGQRRVTAVELVRISRELGHRVEWFVDPGLPVIVSHRATHAGRATSAIDAALDEMSRDVAFVVDHVPALVAGQPGALPVPETLTAADDLATAARSLLSLGPEEPVHDLARLVAGLGLLAFSVELGEGADAGTVLLPAGGVSVVNGTLKVGRRRLALAHELGHYLIADPYTTDWRVASADAVGVEARLDRFARSLLMPEGDIRSRWASWTAVQDETLRDAAVRAGSHYQVDMATLAKRLMELALVDDGQSDMIRLVHTKRADIVEKNLVVVQELAPVSLPRVYEQAVLRMYRNDVVTADRALGLLLGTFDQDSLPELPDRPLGEIWELVS